jgi:hypothetical protein
MATFPSKSRESAPLKRNTAERVCSFTYVGGEYLVVAPLILDRCGDLPVGFVSLMALYKLNGVDSVERNNFITHEFHNLLTW